MKHFVLLTVLLVVVYFGWHYTPSRVKFFIKDFVLRHAGVIITIWVGLWFGLFYAAHNGSISII